MLDDATATQIAEGERPSEGTSEFALTIRRRTLDQETETAWRLLRAASQSREDESHHYLPSSTPPPGDPRGTAVELRYRRLIPLAHDASFEDGVESSYASGLDSFVAQVGSPAVEVVGHYLRAGALPLELASETLIRLGDAARGVAIETRARVLGQALESPHPMIRDAAAVGLASLEHADSAAFVVDALRTEPVPQIRETLKWILQNLSVSGP